MTQDYPDLIVYCSCKGENERCFKCGGTGVLSPADIYEMEHGQSLGLKVGKGKPARPPIFGPFSALPGKPKTKGKTKARKKIQQSNMTTTPTKGYILVGIDGKVRVVSGDPKKNRSKKPMDASLSKLATSALGSPDHNLKTNVRFETKDAKHVAIKTEKRSNSSRKKQSGKGVHSYEDQGKVKTSMQDALEKIIDKSQHVSKSNLDATRDYSHIRDNGQFGSHPSHDEFDE